MKKKITKKAEEFRIDPENYLCSEFDALSMSRYPIDGPKDIGPLPLDDCAREHQQ